MHPKQLADKISSRICHDLISPVGAISNGVELMTAVNGASPELELIQASANSAKAKLMFFRVAFGTSDNSEMLGHAVTVSVATDMFSNGRISVEFPVIWGDRPKSLIKLLYLLILCVESSLPRGGVIFCKPTESGWEISVKDTVVDPVPDFWNAMIDGKPFGDLSSSQIQFQLARDAAENIDIKISSKIDVNSLILVF